MLWHKVWLETRSRFGIGLALLFILAAGSVFEYPVASRLITQADGSPVTNGPLGRVVADALAVQRDFRGFVWWQWHRQNLTQMWTLFAVLLGSGGLLSRGVSSGVLFTMSLPVSRNRLLGVRAATGLAELLVLAIVPTLLIVVLSPVIGERYSLRTSASTACACSSAAPSSSASRCCCPRSSTICGGRFCSPARWRSCSRSARSFCAACRHSASSR